MTMPSEYDRRQLDEIEAALRMSDPELDRALRTFRPRRAWPLMCLIAGWVVAAGAGVTGRWVLTLVLLMPLLVFTWIALGAWWRELPPTATDGQAYPPTWTRF